MLLPFAAPCGWVRAERDDPAARQQELWLVLLLLSLPWAVVSTVGIGWLASLLVLMGLLINAVAAISDLYLVGGRAADPRPRGYFGGASGAKPGEAASCFLPGYRLR